MKPNPHIPVRFLLLKHTLRRLALAGLCLCTAAAAHAHFELRSWTNFEDGKLPDGAVTIGASSEDSLEVVELSTVAGMPAQFLGGESRETGRYALRLRTEPGRPHPGLVLDFVLDRGELGPTGRALFQADVYLPDEKEMPSLAVLAMEAPPEGSAPQPQALPSVRGAYYRFGFTKGTIPFFSCVKPQKANAVAFQNDKDILPHIPKPGWHRLAIMLRGEAEIYCFIDGRATVFSPTHEKTLRRFQVGVLLADGKRAYDTYIDNISIQVTKDYSPVPDSPYNEGWLIPAGEAVRRDASAPLSSAVRDLRWLEPLTAWQTAQRTNKPLLMFFYSPRQDNSKRLNQLFSLNAAATAWLDRHVCTRVDVNQLQGGTIARDYNVFKVPTLLVISPDASRHQQVVPGPDEAWESIVDKLGL